MLKKLFLALIFTTVSLVAMNFQTASKEQLMTIKGIGEKKASAIIKYRKSNKIKSASDLEKVPGIGKELANNAKRGIKNKDPKKTVKKTSTTKTKSTREKSKSSKDKKSQTKKKASNSTKKVKKKAGDSTKRAEKKEKKKIKN